MQVRAGDDARCEVGAEQGGEPRRRVAPGFVGRRGRAVAQRATGVMRLQRIGPHPAHRRQLLHDVLGVGCGVLREDGNPLFGNPRRRLDFFMDGVACGGQPQRAAKQHKRRGGQGDHQADAGIEAGAGVHQRPPQA